jgi:hypothetical protein
MTEVLEGIRKVRDTVYEWAFSALFEGFGASGPRHE